jgi:glycine/D-amino acid oxidase-like deaminating enzyme
MRVVIVGGGIAGLCTAWALRRGGHEPVVLEQGPVPNPLGSSFDEHRMTRFFYPEPSGYGAMVEKARADYELLWADLGETLYRETGILGLSCEAGDWIDRSMPSIVAQGLVHTMLTPQEVAARWPFIDAGGLSYGVHMAKGGVLFAARIVASLARRLGEAVHSHTSVSAIDPARAAARLADGSEIAGDALLVAAGPWIGRLVPALAGRAESHRQVAIYLEAPAPYRAAWDAAPAIVDFGGANDVYAFPSVAGTRIKFAFGEYRRRLEPDRERAVAADEPATILRQYEGRLRDLAGYRVLDARSCCYTMTTDRRFVVERLSERAFAISACSGHGFKFGASLGLGLADALTGRRDAAEFARWAAGRG